MKWMEGLDSISYCMEMLLSAMIFMVYLEKRKNFWLLLTACIPVLFLCSVFIHPFFRVIQNRLCTFCISKSEIVPVFTRLISTPERRNIKR